MLRSLWGMLLMLVILTVSGCNLGPTALSNSPVKMPGQTALSDAQSAKLDSAEPAPSAQAKPLPSLQVDPERLFQQIQALSFERYTDRQRDRARTYLSTTLRDLGWQLQRQAFPGGVNLVARQPGTSPQAGTLLVTAHYDTVQGSPGADDNASSLATALEIARLLGARPTPRTLAFAFFDQEEAGLLGSFAFTAEASNLSDLLGVVNLEMLGYACHTPGCQTYPEGLPIQPPTDRGDFIGIVGDQEHLPLLQAFQTASQASTLPVITLPIPFKGLFTPDLLRSDHAPFWAKNIGAVMVGDTANFRNPHYHQPSDLPETLDRAFLTASAQLVVNAVTTLLTDPAPLTTRVNP